MSDVFTTYARPRPSDNAMEWVEKGGNPCFAIAPLGNLQYAKLTLTAAQVKALHATPITLLAAPGVGRAIQVVDALLYLNFANTAFAAGSTVQLLQNAIAVATTTAALVNNTSAILIQPAFPGVGTTASLGVLNSALTITASGSEFTTGDSTVDVHVWYSVIG